MALWQWLLCIVFWSLFVTIINRYELIAWSDFLISFSSLILQNIIAILPALYLIDYLRPVIKYSNPIKVSFYILLLFFTTNGIATSLVMLMRITVGWLEYIPQDFIINILFNMLIAGGFTLLFLLYFLRRHCELMALKQSFEYKLSVQNDLIKARIAPHFFFNTINSLMTLVESDPPRAADLLQHISALFRASFNGAREISFEEEVALCEHYLAIESSRLADKLVVRWDLPDDDIMYDMIITALTLQNIIEKMLLHVVEMTTETIFIDIKVIWQQHRVTLTVTAQLPSKTLMISYDLHNHVDFHVQDERLKTYFGKSAFIKSKVTNKQIITTIDYPLQDVAL
ncbi:MULTISPECIES: histidine kinase [Psychrobacter]|uniref:histidine kinase n=1 Tax=Psychrobacter TaxID=497 RepID=UPI001D10B724|nr:MULTISPECIES: histidine kinase [Psychrobacter]